MHVPAVTFLANFSFSPVIARAARGQLDIITGDNWYPDEDQKWIEMVVTPSEYMV